MDTLKFKEKFPELNENQIKMLQREILDIVGPDITADKHLTRDYNREDYARDQVNSHKKAIRSRLDTYLHDGQPTPFDEKK